MKYDTTGPVAMGFEMGSWEEAGYTAEHRQEVAELRRFCQARLREDDNSGKGCEMAFHGSFRPHRAFSRWVCTACGGMSFRAVQLGAPPFCQYCGAKTKGVRKHES